MHLNLLHKKAKEMDNKEKKAYGILKDYQLYL